MKPRLTDDELAFILSYVKQMDERKQGRTQTYTELGVKFNRDWKTICGVVQRLSPTVNLGQARLRASVSRLVARLIARADTKDIINILERPNIGVLEPVKKAESSGGGGFFMSMSLDSCGAMQITGGQKPVDAMGVPWNGEDPLALPPAEGTIDPEYEVLGNFNEGSHPPPPPSKNSENTEDIGGVVAQRLARARARLEEARAQERSDETKRVRSGQDKHLRRPKRQKV